MKKLKLLFTAIFAFISISCSTAGPFVTNISSDGKGGLNIEKARVKLNPWTNSLETCETTDSNIQIAPREIK